MVSHSDSYSSSDMQTLLEGKTYPQAGAELYDILVQKIDEPKIVLDMTGVSILPSMFSNMSIGKFIDNYGVDVLRSKISFHKISVSQAQRIKDYVHKYSAQS